MAALARRRPARRSPATVSTADGQLRALTASAVRIDTSDRDQAKQISSLRQPWQTEAWAYRRQLGELRYATSYLGNSVMRLKLFPAAFAPGENVPRPAEEVPGIPADLVEAAKQCLLRIGMGENNSGAQLIRKLTENFEVAGECYLVGREDSLGKNEEWSIYSTSEFHVDDSGQYGVKTTPGASGFSGSNGVEYFKEGTFVSRLWWPDPEWGMYADAPLRSVLDICEELVLLGKDVRATARSRLASNGLLLLPDTLSVVSSNPALAADPRLDPVLQELIATATANLTDEGAASAVVPVALKGPIEALRAVRHLLIQRPEHAGNIAARQELIGRIATGIDLPAEVLQGKADLNHWSAWQVDDDAFRHHIEPIAQVEVDALTVGYLWRMLAAYNRWTPDQIRRVVIWYDPTELVTHPDRGQDAKDAFEHGAVGRQALRDYLGFNDGDKPDELDEILYVLTKASRVEPVLLNAILKLIGSSIQVPLPNAYGPGGAPALPGQGGAGGAGGAPALPPPTGGGGGGMPAAPTPPTSSPTAAPAAGTPAVASMSELDDRLWKRRLESRLEQALTQSTTQLAAEDQTPSGPTEAERRTSTRLAMADRSLRDRLQVAGNQAIKRGLEKAGARVINRVKGRSASRTASAGASRFDFSVMEEIPSWQVPARAGSALIAAIGFDDAKALLDPEMFNELRDLFDQWVEQGQEQALREAAKLCQVDVNTAYGYLAGRFADDRDQAWSWLVDRATARTAKLLSDAGEIDNLSVDTTSQLMPTGTVRGALAIAGGRSPATLSETGTPTDGTMVGGIGTGATVAGFIAEQGGSVHQYEWHHGFTSNPFEPHLMLDGTEFSEFDDARFEVPPEFGSWGASHWAIGDHHGCTCDLFVLYKAPAQDAGREAVAASGAGPKALKVPTEGLSAAGWEEAKHPRGYHGRFGHGSGVSGAAKPPKRRGAAVTLTERVPKHNSLQARDTAVGKARQKVGHPELIGYQMVDKIGDRIQGLREQAKSYDQLDREADQRIAAANKAIEAGLPDEGHFEGGDWVKGRFDHLDDIKTYEHEKWITDGKRRSTQDELDAVIDFKNRVGAVPQKTANLMPDGGPVAADIEKVKALISAGTSLQGELNHRLNAMPEMAKLREVQEQHSELARQKMELLRAQLTERSRLENEYAQTLGYADYHDLVYVDHAGSTDIHQIAQQELDRNAMTVRSDEIKREMMADPERVRLTEQTAQLGQQRADLTNALSQAKRDEAVKLLSELRPMGGEVAGREMALAMGAHDVGRAMERVGKSYPTAWLDRFREMAVSTSNRGYHTSTGEIALSTRYDSLPDDSPYASVALHEWGHEAEYAVPGLKNAEWVYSWMRTSGKATPGSRTQERAKTQNELQALPGYETEFSRRDEWADPYSGKEYGSSTADSHWEIFTVGIQAVMAGDNSADPEHEAFVLGAMAVL